MQPLWRSAVAFREEPNGLIYQTTAQRNAFKFEEWNDTYGLSPLYSYSVDKNSLAHEQLSEILRDEKVKKVLPKGSYLEMEQGYRLLLRGIEEGGLAYVQLFKDGQVFQRILLPLRSTGSLAR